MDEIERNRQAVLAGNVRVRKGWLEKYIIEDQPTVSCIKHKKTGKHNWSRIESYFEDGKFHHVVVCRDCGYKHPLKWQEENCESDEDKLTHQVWDKEKIGKKSHPEEVFRRFYKSKLLRLFLFLIGGIRREESE